MLGLAGVLGTLYLWRGGEPLLFLFIVCCMVMLGGGLLQLSGPKKLQITRTFSPPHPAAGDTVAVEVKVRFSSRIPLPWMIIADYWRGGVHQELLFPGFRRSFTYTYELKEVPRGIHQLQGCRVRWGDLPGLFTGKVQLAGEESFKVLPRPVYVSGAIQGSSILSGGIRHSAKRNSGVEDADIRDYEPGDPLSRIHWKNSARKGTLQSRVPEREQGRMSCIVLANHPENFEIPYGAWKPRGQRGSVPSAFEQAVSVAMGLMLAAERSGAYVQLFSGGWPEGMARHEGVGKIPGRVQDLLTEIAADGTQSLSRLLEDASRNWLPGMTIAVITGQLEEESAKILARFLVQGVKVELYYAWDMPAPVHGGQISGHSQRGAGRLGASPDKHREWSGMTGTAAREQHFTDEINGWAPGAIQHPAGTVGGSLARLGARIYRLEDCFAAAGYRGADFHGYPEKPTVR